MGKCTDQNLELYKGENLESPKRLSVHFFFQQVMFERPFEKANLLAVSRAKNFTWLLFLENS